VYEINKAGAAARACDAVAATTPGSRASCRGDRPDQPHRLDQPDVNDPGFRNISFDELANLPRSHRGPDRRRRRHILVETIFDTLNAKAAMYAVEERSMRVGAPADDDLRHHHRRLRPHAVRPDHRSLHARWRHARPLSIGLNCALGADAMRPHVETCRRSPTATSPHPNAGLPNAFGEYDETPEDMASTLRGFAEDGLLNLVGGCCGSTPDHIRAIAAPCRLPPRALPGRSTA
jgi:5-methyltetrahydrofolate--homocysteine methyltransferase